MRVGNSVVSIRLVVLVRSVLVLRVLVLDALSMLCLFAFFVEIVAQRLLPEPVFSLS